VKVTHLFAGLPDAALAEELITPVLQGGSFRLERIVSEGHATASGEWYDQPSPEWVVLLRGRAHLRFDGEAVATALEPGDAVLIPAHARHRVEWTDPHERTIWLALHFEAPRT